MKSFTGHELIRTINQSNPVMAEDKFRKLIGRCQIIASIKKEGVVDEPTMAILWECALKNYDLYTFEEIETAVTYNESNLLDERVEHFHAFSLNFFTRVMGNWFQLKNRTKQRVSALLPLPEIKPETNESLYQGLLNYINVNKKFPEMWAWSKVYQHMDECLMISESNDEKREVFEKVKAKINKQIEFELLSVSGFIERQGIMDGAEDRAKVECRKLLIIKHLSHLLK